MVITMAKLRMAHASTHGARKPPGPTSYAWRMQARMAHASRLGQNCLFFYIPSSYAKIWGQEKFQPQEFPRSGSKAKDVKEERKRAKQVLV